MCPDVDHQSVLLSEPGGSTSVQVLHTVVVSPSSRPTTTSDDGYRFFRTIVSSCSPHHQVSYDVAVVIIVIIIILTSFIFVLEVSHYGFVLLQEYRFCFVVIVIKDYQMYKRR